MSQALKLLIVDDEPAIRELLDNLLADDHSTTQAADGEEAWDLISSSQGEFDIVFTDIHMPKLDGVGLLKRIRQEYPKICVIITSGTSDIDRAIKAIRLGAYDYISKPFNSLDEIEILIQRWVEHQSLEAKLLQYADLHKEILHSLKIRTFLCLDVIGSKKIKSGEDPLLMHYSFLAYNRFVESIVVKNAGRIHSTAGDGVMTCFVLPQAAINAAQEILTGLAAFNRTTNRLSNAFALRMSIHTGSVIIEESGRVNEMYSESLDVTGHIQKDAGANQIEVSSETVENLTDKTLFTLLGKEIDGFQIYTLNLD